MFLVGCFRTKIYVFSNRTLYTYFYREALWSVDDICSAWTVGPGSGWINHNPCCIKWRSWDIGRPAYDCMDCCECINFLWSEPRNCKCWGYGAACKELEQKVGYYLYEDKYLKMSMLDHLLNPAWLGIDTWKHVQRKM